MDFISTVWDNWIVNILDILIVYYIFYRLILVIKGTRALQIVIGLLVLMFLTLIAKDILHLQTVAWLLGKFWIGAVVILAVVFNDEIRLVLAKLGAGFSKFHFYHSSVKKDFDFLEELTESAIEMSKARIGGLIVLEKEMGLQNYSETGIVIDAQISQELILSIFNTKAPVHDGAIIIKDARIHSAGCVLPLSNSIENKHLGTRHRAGLGLASVTDSVILIVSEENGNISIAYEGKIETIEQENLLNKLKYCYYKKVEL